MPSLASKLRTQLLMICLIGIPSFAAAESFIIHQGEANAIIILPETTGRATILAAEELRNHLEQITGARLPINYGETYLADKVSIYLKPRVLDQDVKADGSEDIFRLLGNRDGLTIEGNTELAVLYGVYHYLEEHLGVRWFMPGPNGTVLPSMENIRLEPIDQEVIPSFRTREFSLSGSPVTHFHSDPIIQNQQLQDYSLWLMRNRSHFGRGRIVRRMPYRYDFNWARDEQYHNIQRAALFNADFELEPERFSLMMVDGEARRLPRGERFSQICFTHPANHDAAVQSAVSFFEQNPQLLSYSLSLQDYRGGCMCPDCVEANEGLCPWENPDPVMWKFANSVARRLREQIPGKNVCFYSSYMQLSHPPAGLQAEDGVIGVTARVVSHGRDIDTCRYDRYYNNIKKTSASGATMGAREYLLFSMTPQPLAIMNSVRTYHDHNFIWYHVESMGRDDLKQMVVWILSKLTWNVEQDPEQLLEEFCRGYFGAAGPELMSVIKAIDEQARKVTRVGFGSLGSTQEIMTDQLIGYGRQILAEARQRVDGIERERVESFADTFEMFSLMGQAIRQIFTFYDQRTDNARELALDKIARFEQFWNDRNMAMTASARLEHLFTDLSSTIKQLPPPAPRTRPDLAEAEMPELLQALFSLDQVPENLANLQWLPEIWRFRPDVNAVGLDQGWMAPDYDDSEWAELSTYNFIAPQGYPEYLGHYWYRLSFEADEFPEDQSVYLRIGSLDAHNGLIYLNGELIHNTDDDASHSWRRSFELDVTGKIIEGQANSLAIHGHAASGQAGLWRPVALYTK